jgi:hypothetical protein
VFQSRKRRSTSLSRSESGRPLQNARADGVVFAHASPWAMFTYVLVVHTDSPAVHESQVEDALDVSASEGSGQGSPSPKDGHEGWAVDWAAGCPARW